MGSQIQQAAAISVGGCIFLVIVPGLAVLGALLKEGGKLYTKIKSGSLDLQPLAEKLESILPEFVTTWLQQLDIQSFKDLNASLSAGLVEGGGFFASRALSLGQNTFGFVISAGVMLYLLFFFLRDGRELVRAVRNAVPLSDDHTRKFADKFTAVVKATVRGSLIIALVQATIGGLAFWFLDLEPAMLWAVVMFFFSLLPVLGTAIVWAPASIYLAVGGLWLKAVLLVFVGVLAIGLVDNLLRPRLVSSETSMPDFVVLLSTLGGLSVLGANGLLVGPLIAALFISAWTIFAEEAAFNPAGHDKE
ncbi:hypothetical protein LPJGGPFB_05129 [Ensifer adhaerens]|uniref:AI-2E family transporter n=1 Tax=Ensifer adhaerens TaxID=106592 RepID=UPI001F467233|nr:AI-2E family transporter [Ensifer adhaerens]NRP21870.1 hypothetical protein [Ensifer adhaerens]